MQFRNSERQIWNASFVEVLGFLYDINLPIFLKWKTIFFIFAVLVVYSSLFLFFLQINSRTNDVKILRSTCPSTPSYKNTQSGMFCYVFSFSFILSICDFTSSSSKYELSFSHMLGKTKHAYITTGIVSSFKSIFLKSILHLAFNLPKVH